ERVAGPQRAALDPGLTLGHVQPAAAPRVGRERDVRAFGQARAEQPGLLADGDAAVGAVGRGQQRPAPLARGRVEGALVVARRRVHAVGLDPDLQEVHRPGIAGVVLAVFDAVAGA